MAPVQSIRLAGNRPCQLCAGHRTVEAFGDTFNCQGCDGTGREPEAAPSPLAVLADCEAAMRRLADQDPWLWAELERPLNVARVVLGLPSYVPEWSPAA